MEEPGVVPQPEAVLIVLAEDDEGHATLVKRNLVRAGVVNEIVHVHDGQELLELLLGAGTKSPLAPGAHVLVLLDLRMPRMDGIQALRRLRASSVTDRLPVIMLTTTDDPREIEECYGAGCNAYVTKPVSCEAFTDAVRRLGLFLQLVRLPRARTPGGGAS